MVKTEISEAPGHRLVFTETAPDEYVGHVEGLGLVYWIHRSPVWGDRWQAFLVERNGSRRAMGERYPNGRLCSINQYRNDLFEFLRGRPLSGVATREPAEVCIATLAEIEGEMGGECRP